MYDSCDVQSDSVDELRNRKREEQISNHLISSSRRRDFNVASKLLEKMRTILLSPSGAWSSKDESKRYEAWNMGGNDSEFQPVLET